MKTRINSVTLFLNGKIKTLNQNGESIPELEGRYTSELIKEINRYADEFTVWENFPELPEVIPQPRRKSKRFEYLAKLDIEVDDHEQLAQYLNTLGTEGWELIQYETIILYGVLKVRMLNPVFKREMSHETNS